MDLNQRSLSATDLQSAPFDQTLAFSLIWWTLQESNPGRADLQSAALPTELRVRVGCESGLEPPTSGATNRRSDQLSYSHYEWLQGRESNPLGQLMKLLHYRSATLQYGARSETRTCDLLIDTQARYPSALRAVLWHRTVDLNHVLLSQSQACCRYTSPVFGTLCGI